jgi:hypothetical protein
MVVTPPKPTSKMKNAVLRNSFCMAFLFLPLFKSEIKTKATPFYYFVSADCSCSNSGGYADKKFHKYFSAIKKGEKTYGSFDDREVESRFIDYIIATYSHCPWDRTTIQAHAYTSSRNFKTYDEALDARTAEIAAFKRSNPQWEIHY